jgi:hypothetical protein
MPAIARKAAHGSSCGKMRSSLGRARSRLVTPGELDTPCPLAGRPVRNGIGCPIPRSEGRETADQLPIATQRSSRSCSRTDPVAVTPKICTSPRGICLHRQRDQRGHCCTNRQLLPLYILARQAAGVDGSALAQGVEGVAAGQGDRFAAQHGAGQRMRFVYIGCHRPASSATARGSRLLPSHQRLPALEEQLRLLPAVD